MSGWDRHAGHPLGCQAATGTGRASPTDASKTGSIEACPVRQSRLDLNLRSLKRRECRLASHIRCKPGLPGIRECSDLDTPVSVSSRGAIADGGGCQACRGMGCSRWCGNNRRGRQKRAGHGRLFDRGGRGFKLTVGGRYRGAGHARVIGRIWVAGTERGKVRRHRI